MRNKIFIILLQKVFIYYFIQKEEKTFLSFIKNKNFFGDSKQENETLKYKLKKYEIENENLKKENEEKITIYQSKYKVYKKN